MHMTLQEYLKDPEVRDFWKSTEPEDWAERSDGMYDLDRPGTPDLRLITYNVLGADVEGLGSYADEGFDIQDIPGTEGAGLEKVIAVLKSAAMAINTDPVDQVLAERGARYGTFEQNGELYTALKKLLTTDKASPTQQMCLDMIAMKLSRMINGDVNYRDNWIDIIGYCKGALGEGDE